MIKIISHDQASEFISLSGPYLEQKESENNLPLGLAYRLAEDPYYYGPELPLLLSILEQGKVVGVAMMTPPKRITLSRIDTEIQAAIVPLVRHLRDIDTRIPRVAGPAVEAQAFSNCWVEGMLDVSARISMRMRIFETRSVANLPLSPGKLRLARPEEHPLMARWIADYSETVGKPISFDIAKSWTEALIQNQQLHIWDTEGPVSIAAVDRPTRNGIAIHSVYTPPEHRNKGYATSSVLLLTQKMLTDRYSFCCLYTDLSNPTSNSIYAKIGYVPVGDALIFDFISSDEHKGD
ncbi:MAG: GNAT family N-acetyltransferase [Candidatus Poribacteria bacterium]|nr:GNAT family N-acetyltransferase [Candidatus Poribacteria bacterium]